MAWPSGMGTNCKLRDVSKELAARGFLNELGKPYAREVCGEHAAVGMD